MGQESTVLSLAYTSSWALQTHQTGTILGFSNLTSKLLLKGRTWLRVTKIGFVVKVGYGLFLFQVSSPSINVRKCVTVGSITSFYICLLDIMPRRRRVEHNALVVVVCPSVCLSVCLFVCLSRA